MVETAQSRVIFLCYLSKRASWPIKVEKEEKCISHFLVYLMFVIKGNKFCRCQGPKQRTALFYLYNPTIWRHSRRMYIYKAWTTTKHTNLIFVSVFFATDLYEWIYFKNANKTYTCNTKASKKEMVNFLIFLPMRSKWENRASMTGVPYNT